MVSMDQIVTPSFSIPSIDPQEVASIFYVYPKALPIPRLWVHLLGLTVVFVEVIQIIVKKFWVEANGYLIAF